MSLDDQELAGNVRRAFNAFQDALRAARKAGIKVWLSPTSGNVFNGENNFELSSIIKETKL
jgi:hypothetical protein